MRIYIATKFENQEEYRKLKRLLEAEGHQITFDWTGESLKDIPPERHHEYLLQCAEKDMQGVLNADALILIHHDKMVGAYVEMGMAIADMIPIIVVDPKGESHNIFNHLGGVTIVKNYAEAIAAL